MKKSLIPGQNATFPLDTHHESCYDLIKMERQEIVMNMTFDFGDGPVPAKQHSNGGGWVADTATVSDTAFVGSKARVYDSARVSDYASIYDYARVYGNARVSDDACISDSAWVFDNAHVSGDACVSGSAWVFGDVHVFGDTRVTGDEWVCEFA
jgi:UDP-3-O-[3-hydroxymyristoyl] glucosamine N-acyltransferase